MDRVGVSVDIETLSRLLTVLNEVIHDLRLDLELMLQHGPEKASGNIPSLMAIQGHQLLAHLKNNREQFYVSSIAEVGSRQA